MLRFPMILGVAVVGRHHLLMRLDVGRHPAELTDMLRLTHTRPRR